MQTSLWLHRAFHVAVPLVALLAAIVSGAVSVWNTRRLNQNGRSLEELKLDNARNVERLKAQLTHSGHIAAAQWEAEFRALQSIWKGFVPLRGLTHKLLTRDEGIAALGIVDDDISAKARADTLDALLKKFAEAITHCMTAINENGPFIPAGIRNRANEVHSLCHALFSDRLAASVALRKGWLPAPVGAEANETYWRPFVIGLGEVETMIRNRMDELRQTP